jgi:NAD(P)-dependent dehydrogenase (short-subunit alcohol dehydrogenase family)
LRNHDQASNLTSAASWQDFRGRAVLVTGGTKGIGLATGLAFGRRGAAVTLTHKWGSVDPEAVRAAFAAAGAEEPAIIDADVAQEDDVRAVMSAIKDHHDGLDTLVSNVAFAPLIHRFEDYTRRGLATAIDYSTWPIVSHTQAAKQIFGSYPRYVIGVSSQGMGSFAPRYDAVAMAKAALEVLCRYMHQRLRDQGTRVNLISTRYVATESLRATLGEDFEAFAEAHAPGLFTTAEEVAEAVVGLCSGLMDGLGGQTVVIDRGASVFDNIARLYAERDKAAGDVRGPA